MAFNSIKFNNFQSNFHPINSVQLIQSYNGIKFSPIPKNPAKQIYHGQCFEICRLGWKLKQMQEKKSKQYWNNIFIYKSSSMYSQPVPDSIQFSTRFKTEPHKLWIKILQNQNQFNKIAIVVLKYIWQLHDLDIKHSNTLLKHSPGIQ